MNPLFDKAGFVDFAGRVINPSRGVPKRFRLEMILPVAPGSIRSDSVQAFVVPASIGPFTAIPDAPPFLGDLPGTPLTTIRLDRLDLVRRGTGAVAVLATFDRDGFAAAAGRDVVIQVDPRAWRFTTPTSDSVFGTPTRFTFHVSERGPDGDPPFLVDVTGFATDPLDELLDPLLAPSQLPVVPPHARLRFLFSEPMLAAAPLVLPQDPAGLQLRPETFDGGGFLDLVSATQAGLVPGQEYCVSFVPPDMAAIGPLSWGSQDLSGEPLVPAFRTAGMRRAARRLRGATDFCFRTGGARIEWPRHNAVVAAANGLPPMTFVSQPLCEPDVGCPSGAGWRISVKRDDEGSEIGTGWVDLGFFGVDDPTIQVTRTNGLHQGELVVPVDSVAVPLGGPISPPIFPLCFGGDADPDACNVLLRVDRCLEGICTLGDVLGVVLDARSPPRVVSEDVQVDDADTNDGRIDRVCVVVNEAEADEVLVVAVFDGSHELASVQVSAGEATSEDLGGGRVRRCVSDIPLESEGEAGDARTLTVTANRRDASGNAPLIGASVAVSCALPPRKHVGYGGRQSALTVDRAGIPHAVWVDDRSQNPSLVYARWSPETDVWETRTLDQLCPPPSPGPGGGTQRRCAGGYGWYVDIDINARDEPVLCYSKTTFQEGTALAPGWELENLASVHVLRIRADGTVDGTRVGDHRGESNLGCRLAARRSRPDGTVADYLVSYVTDSPDAPGGPYFEARLSYVRDDGTALLDARLDGTIAPWGRLPEPFRNADARFFDVAVDGNDAFWAVLPCRLFAACVIGERPRGEVPGSPHPLLGPDFAGRLFRLADDHLSRPRIAARADGEFALVFTDEHRELRFVHRRGEPPDAPLVSNPVAPLPALALEAYGDGSVVRPEARTPNFLNNGGLASLDEGGFGGIPADVAFVAGQTRPLFTWIAARPNGLDYHALLVARPDQTSNDYDFEVVDGRVALSAAVSVGASAGGAIRVAYHNGLGSRLEAPAVDPGSLLFYREEDEDEIRRSPSHPTRGGARCFSRSLEVQDQEGPRGARAALDSASAALVPRPAIDPDPCGRTIDPGLDEAVASRASLGRRPSLRELPQHYARLPGESDDSLINRTNFYRAQAFERLRAALRWATWRSWTRPSGAPMDCPGGISIPPRWRRPTSSTRSPLQATRSRSPRRGGSILSS